jgi:hypothetical protein
LQPHLDTQHVEFAAPWEGDEADTPTFASQQGRQDTTASDLLGEAAGAAAASLSTRSDGSHGRKPEGQSSGCPRPGASQREVSPPQKRRRRSSATSGAQRSKGKDKHSAQTSKRGVGRNADTQGIHEAEVASEAVATGAGDKDSAAVAGAQAPSAVVLPDFAPHAGSSTAARPVGARTLAGAEAFRQVGGKSQGRKDGRRENVRAGASVHRVEGNNTRGSAAASSGALPATSSLDSQMDGGVRKSPRLQHATATQSGSAAHQAAAAGGAAGSEGPRSRAMSISRRQEPLGGATPIPRTSTKRAATAGIRSAPQALGAQRPASATSVRPTRPPTGAARRAASTTAPALTPRTRRRAQLELLQEEAAEVTHTSVDQLVQKAKEELQSTEDGPPVLRTSSGSVPAAERGRRKPHWRRTHTGTLRELEGALDALDRVSEGSHEEQDNHSG